MERWLRVHFQKPYGAISGLRFWVSGLVPNTDWAINWGTTTTYVKPIDGYSAFANEPILTADPGIQNVPLNIDATGRTYAYSDWIILQAVYAGSTPGSMQSGPVNLNLAWSVA